MNVACDYEATKAEYSGLVAWLMISSPLTTLFRKINFDTFLKWKNLKSKKLATCTAESYEHSMQMLITEKTWLDVCNSLSFYNLVPLSFNKGSQLGDLLFP